MTHDEGMTTTRTAIVTGAARGIGRAIALRLATDGHHVAVLDLDESACQVVVDEITEGGGTALAVGVDVSDGAVSSDDEDDDEVLVEEDDDNDDDEEDIVIVPSKKRSVSDLDEDEPKLSRSQRKRLNKKLKAEASGQKQDKVRDVMASMLTDVLFNF